MSEQRRRRRQNSEDSEHSEGEVKVDKVGGEELDIEKDEGVDSAPEPEQGDSEYESADDDIEIVDELINNKDGELDGGGEEPYPGIERQEGDGEETPSSPTTLDDDEDKKNPQYIPKRGMFYEHDDRIDPADEVECEGEEEEKPDLKKKIWKADAAVKWGHDKFMEMEQEPKNQEELVAAYGYDIRNEDNAPRARRRRRYGRGPNKYTRNWEDEDAYVKPAAPRGRGVAPVRGVMRGGKTVMIEDFPALPSKDDDEEEEEQEHEREPLKREKSMTEIKPERKPEFKREKSTPEFKTHRERDDRNRNNRNSREKDDESFQARRGRGRGDFHGGRGGESYGGGRGQGFGRGRGRDDQFAGRGGGRGGRGGYDGYDQPRGGRGGRGGFDDRGRGGGDRRMREENNRNYQGGVNDNEHRGGGRGRGGRGRGRGMEDRHHEGGIGNRRQTDQGVTVKPDLSDDIAHMDLNKDNENSGGNRGAKRYSNQRRGGPDHSNVNHNLQEMYAEGIDPSLCSGPPSGPPFQTPMSNTRLSMNTAVSQSGMGTVPASFIAPSQAILNYGPQFQVPATAVSLGLGAVVTSGLPLTAIPNLAGTITTGVGMPLMAADPMLLAAAAHGPDSFTDVRGGVTYFNPTAQNFLPQRHVSKRAKAPIAIVDPSQMQRGNSVPKEESDKQDINFNGVKKEDSLPCESNLASSESISKELTAEQ